MSAVLLGEDLIGRDNLVTEGIAQKPSSGKRRCTYRHRLAKFALFADKGIETGNDLQPQLYDLNADIGQRENLATKYPNRVDELHARLLSIHGILRRRVKVRLKSAV